MASSILVREVKHRWLAPHDAMTELASSCAVRLLCDPSTWDWLQADVVFMSPPWGGPHYIKDELYDADTSLAGFGGLRGLMEAALGAIRTTKPAVIATAQLLLRLDITTTASSGCPAVAGIDAGSYAESENGQVPDAVISDALPLRRGIAMFLPRQTDLRQLSAAAPEGTALEVERAVLDGFVKGITVYLWIR